MRAAKVFRPFFALLTLLAGIGGAQAQKIGVIAPLSGQFSLLGLQMQEGAQTAAEALSIASDNFMIEDDACTSDGGQAAANDLADWGADIVVGFLCTDAIEAALPVFEATGIPVITPGVRTDSLTDDRAKTGWLIYRTAPRADAERKAVNRILVDRWRDSYFAIVDDGTIYGRELAESFRLAAEEAGLKPVFVDTYRPQMDNQIALVGRLSRAGATHVFVGGDRQDIAIIARDANKAGTDLTIAGGEALRAAPGAVPLTAGVLMIGLPEPATEANDAALKKFESRGFVPEGYMLPTYAAVQVAKAALAASDSSDKSLPDVLDSQSFDTATGTVKFDAKGDLATNPYRLFRYDGTHFVEVKQ